MQGLLILGLWLAPVLTAALGVPRACRTTAPELLLGRECFRGDMHVADDYGTFLDTEIAPNGAKYCYGTFILGGATRGSVQPLTVFRNDDQGRLHIYSYTLNDPAARRVSFQNLDAKCFATRIDQDHCQKALFGFGGSDLKLGVELLRSPRGTSITHGLTSAAQVKTASALKPVGEQDAGQMDQWLLQVVKHKLLSSASLHLAQISRGQLRGPALATSTTQFRYCRMAFEGLVRQKKLSDPLTPLERKTLDGLEQRLNAPAP